MEKLGLPESVSEERLKGVIGRLLAIGELEYVDYRCYRVYDKFKTALINCTEVDERNKNFILGRLEGKTLENIAQEYEITRERVRQLVKKNAEKVRNWYVATTGKKWFDEDYYRYFFETYEFDNVDCDKWLGISEDTYNYFLMMDVRPGKKELESALDDYENLDVGFRMKIKNYLNRNRIFINGAWIEKNRAKLEEVAVKYICQDNISYSDFTREFNKFLEKEEIEYDEKLYYTEEIYRTRKNRLSS